MTKMLDFTNNLLKSVGQAQVATAKAMRTEQTSDQCQNCFRIVGNPNPHVTLDRDGVVIACEDCLDAPEPDLSKRRSAEKPTTMQAAQRYCEIFPDAYIVGDRWLYQKRGRTHKVVAEIVSEVTDE